jgi:hypothetical protein
MLRTEPWLVAVAVAALYLVGCKPEIGDECTVSSDCSAAGDRLCDNTQPGGYCTIFNCEPGTCPEEAICVAFGSSISTVPACVDPQRRSRYEEIYCVKNCEDDDDCRGGYACVDLGDPAQNPGRAVVVEYGSVDGRVCLVPYSVLPMPPDRSSEVCTGNKGPFKEIDAGTNDAQPGDSGADAPPDAASDGDAADGAAE